MIALYYGVVWVCTMRRVGTVTAQLVTRGVRVVGEGRDGGADGGVGGGVRLG